MREAILRKAYFLLTLSTLCLTGTFGCAPEFTSSDCTSSSDCFSDEECGPAGVCLPKTLVDKIEIASFSADPMSVSSSSTDVTLSWEIVGSVKTVSLTDDEGNEIPLATPTALKNSVTVTVAKTTTYTLRVQSLRGADESKTVTVEKIANPQITRFISQPTLIVKGEMATLGWDVLDATSLQLSDDKGNMIDLAGKDLARDTVDVAPEATTTYTLTAKDGDVSVTKDTVITVEDAPMLSASLMADKMVVKKGESVTLSWVTTDASDISLTSSDGTSLDITSKELDQDTLVVVPLDATTTYTLRAEGPTAPVESMVTINVEPLDASIKSFVVSEGTITQGDKITLSYETEGITGLMIKAVGVVSNTERMLTTAAPYEMGQLEDTPTESTTYTMTATNGTDILMRTATVSVVGEPVVDAFMADVTTLRTGESVTLNWQLSNAATVMLRRDDGVTMDMIPVTMDMSGAGQVVRQPGRDTTYTLVATNDAGRMAMQSVMVTVSEVGLLITEIMRKPTATPDMLQWVEVYNPTDLFVDLSSYSLEGGAANLKEFTQPLTGISIPPQGCVVIGGPTSDATNGSPTFDLASDFAPNIPVAQGALALVYSPKDVLVDTVVFEGGTFPGEGGVAMDSEITPAEAEGSSLLRFNDMDIFAPTPMPTPGTCFSVVFVNGASGTPNESTQPLEFQAYGLDLDLVSVKLGPNALTNCTLTAPQSYQCDPNYTGLVGPQDFIIEQDKEYTKDMAGMTVITPRMAPFPSSSPVPVRFTARENDTSADFYCGIVDSGSPAVMQGMPISVQAEIFVLGETDGPNLDIPAGWQVEVGVFTPGTTPYQLLPLLTWRPAAKSGTSGPAVLYDADITSPQPLMGEAAVRIKRATDNSYVYCDRLGAVTQGSDNGWDTNGGLPVQWIP